MYRRTQTRNTLYTESQVEYVDILTDVEVAGLGSAKL